MAAQGVTVPNAFLAAATAVPQINRLSPRNTPRLRARKLAKLSCTCDNRAPFDEA
jgi:hypothetical protein